MNLNAWDIGAVRAHFDFPERGRVVTNNAASTQPPRELLELYHTLTADYENVHRGQSDASQATTRRFEAAYDTVAQFLNAPSRRNIALYRNTTEAINTVMYSLLTEFRDGDNVVSTLMEHNSNYVPRYALCREILPRFGRNAEYRLVRFDPKAGELDLEHLASLIDSRTKLVCCTGASNFPGTKNPLPVIRQMANSSGYVQPNGESRSYLLVDGAQLVPGSFVDVQALEVEYLAFSLHKMLAPFGVGGLYAKEHLLEAQKPSTTLSKKRIKTGGLIMQSQTADPIYFLGRADAETRRLVQQGRFYNSLTHTMLQQADLRPGMKVLDVGRGAGEVALLAHELVGEHGRWWGWTKTPRCWKSPRRERRPPTTPTSALYQVTSAPSNSLETSMR